MSIPPLNTAINHDHESTTVQDFYIATNKGADDSVCFESFVNPDTGRRTHTDIHDTSEKTVFEKFSIRSHDAGASSVVEWSEEAPSSQLSEKEKKEVLPNFSELTKLVESAVSDALAALNQGK